MTAPTRAATEPNAEIPAPRPATDGSLLDRLAQRIGVSRRTLAAGILLPVIALVIIAVTTGVAPADQRATIVLASLVGVAAGLSSTAIGVYGGVLVPGLLLLGIDARFAAALSLFLQVLVIPLAASSHYRMGNFSRRVALPLVIGGVIGAFIGPFFAAALPKDVIARVVAAMIVFVGAIVLATGVALPGGVGRVDRDRCGVDGK